MPQKLTDRTEQENLTLDDWIHVVQSGESWKAKLSAVKNLLVTWIETNGVANVSINPAARRRVIWFETVAGVAGINAFGSTLNVTGTGTAVTLANTSLYASMRRQEALVTTPSTTAVAGYRNNSTGAPFWRGNAAGRGGFYVRLRTGPATGQATATARFFAGLQQAGTPADVEPSSLTDIIGFGWDSGDANAQIIHNDASGAASKIDLGASFAVSPNDREKVYDIELFCAPAAAEIFYRVRDLVTGASAAGSVSTDLLSDNVFVGPSIFASVGGTNSVIGAALFTIYGESPN